MKPNAGFSLLEVIICLGLILILSVALSSLLRTNLDIREELALKASVNHRLNAVIQAVAQDLQHVFMISSEKDLERFGENRKIKTYFKVDTSRDNDEVWMTTMSHTPLLANAKESDTTLVVYRLQDSPESDGKTHLYRGTFPRIPENIKEDPPMRLLAKYIKGFRIRPWLGDDWSRDRWDSTRSDYRNKLPHMVKVELDAWAIDPLEGREADKDKEPPVTSLFSVIYLPQSLGIAEIKTGSNSIRWDKL